MVSNQNVPFIRHHQYVTTGAASNPSAELGTGTKMVTLYATAAAWVLIGNPGVGTPVAVKDGAQKTVSASFYLPATTFMSTAVPRGTDAARVKVAAIQDSGAGSVHIYEHED